MKKAAQSGGVGAAGGVVGALREKASIKLECV